VPSVVRGHALKFSFCVPVLVPVRASPVPKEKKENRQPKGGMGGRHAATTQGF